MFMMTANEHIMFTLSSILFCKKMKFTTPLAKGDISHILIGGIITCLLPDIDHPRSILGYKLTLFSFPIWKIFGHRGFTHSLLAIIVFLLILNFNKFIKFIFPLDFIHAMIVGYISHILADMFTPIGVPLMWPYRYKFHIPILTIKKKNICKILLITNIIYSFSSPILFFLKI